MILTWAPKSLDYLVFEQICKRNILIKDTLETLFIKAINIASQIIQ